MAHLRAGQVRVAIALLDADPPATYQEVASALSIHVGTVRRHLKRIRDRRPDVYARIMAERRAQLDRYHSVVETRRMERSRRWGRHRFCARYRADHGRWPWEVMRSG
jgi:hypothetical protein